MKTALWIIAICEIIRLAQNAAQLMMTRTAMKGDKKHQDAALKAFIKSLNSMDGAMFCPSCGARMFDKDTNVPGKGESDG